MALANSFSLRFHFDVLGILEWQKGHKIGVMDDERFRRSPDQITFRSVCRDDVAHGIGHAALQRQRHPRERMPQRFSPLTLAAFPIGSKFVFQQLAYVGQNRPGDHRVDVDSQRASHKRLHRSGTISCDVHDAAFVFHESDRTVWNQECEWDLGQVFSL